MDSKLMHNNWGKVSGEVREKFLSVWGKEEYLGLSSILASFPQSYPHGFARVLQGFIPRSTDSTTITKLLTIY